LLEGESQRIAGRMRTALIKAAKERSGITSLRGSVSPDLDLEF
jgi:hypothetical protein